MPRNTSYTARLDISDIQRQARRLRSIFAQQMRQVTIIDTSQANQAATSVNRISNEMRQLQAATQQANAAAGRLSSTLQQVSAPQGGTSGGLGGLQGALLGGAAGYLSVQGARQVVEQSAALSDLAAQARRTGVAFNELSGSSTIAAANLEAIKGAAGGTITTLQAQQIGTQALSLGLANTTEEFEKLVRAGRAVTIVSPVIDDLGNALTEIGLAAANQSFRRLDQLGLGVTEVKDRMAELKRETSGLSDEQAFATAAVDLLNSKYGAIIDSSAGAATGVELLRTRFADLRTELAERLSPAIDDAALQIAEAFGADVPTAAIFERLSVEANENQFQRFISGTKGAREELEQLEQVYKRYLAVAQAGLATDQQSAQVKALADAVYEGNGATEEAIAMGDQLSSSLERQEGTLTAMHLTAAKGTGELYQLADSESHVGSNAAEASDEVDDLHQSMIEMVASLGAAGNAFLQAAIGIGETADSAAAAKTDIDALYASLQQIQGAGAGIQRSIVGQYADLAAVVGEAAASEAIEEALAGAQEDIDAVTTQAALSGDPLSLLELEKFRVKSAEQNRSYIDGVIEADEQRKKDAAEAQREAERLAKQQARDAERAAEKAAREMEQAMLRAAAEMESALRNVAGLFDVSDVTQGQLDAAGVGLYADQADEFLRRLRSAAEGEDLFPELTIEEAFDKAREALARINADVGDGTPAAIVAALDAAWEDSRLFADTQNLELINEDAVRAQLDRAAEGSKGEQNILSFFGIDPDTGFLSEDVGVGTALRADLESGEVSAAMASQLQQGVASADVAAAVSQAFSGGEAGTGLAQGFGEGVDLATPFLRSMRQSFEQETIINGFLAIGRDVAGYVADGFGAGVEEENWAATVLDGVAASVGETLESSVSEATGDAP